MNAITRIVIIVWIILVIVKYPHSTVFLLATLLIIVLIYYAKKRHECKIDSYSSRLDSHNFHTHAPNNLADCERHDDYDGDQQRNEDDYKVHAADYRTHAEGADNDRYERFEVMAGNGSINYPSNPPSYQSDPSTNRGVDNLGLAESEHPYEPIAMKGPGDYEEPIDTSGLAPFDGQPEARKKSSNNTAKKPIKKSPQQPKASQKKDPRKPWPPTVSPSMEVRASRGNAPSSTNIPSPVNRSSLDTHTRVKTATSVGAPRQKGMVFNNDPKYAHLINPQAQQQPRQQINQAGQYLNRDEHSTRQPQRDNGYAAHRSEIKSTPVRAPRVQQSRNASKTNSRKVVQAPLQEQEEIDYDGIEVQRYPQEDQYVKSGYQEQPVETGYDYEEPDHAETPMNVRERNEMLARERFQANREMNMQRAYRGGPKPNAASKFHGYHVEAFQDESGEDDDDDTSSQPSNQAQSNRVEAEYSGRIAVQAAAPIIPLGHAKRTFLPVNFDGSLEQPLPVKNDNPKMTRHGAARARRVPKWNDNNEIKPRNDPSDMQFTRAAQLEKRIQSKARANQERKSQVTSMFG